MPESPIALHSEVIDLTAIPPLRQGNMRNIRLLPQFPGLVLKTIRPELVDQRGLFRIRNRVQNLRSRGCQSASLREIDEFLIQCRMRHRQVGYRLPITHIFGFVPTTEGLGMLVERIVDSHGELAPTISTLVKSNSIGPQHMAALESFWTRCRTDHVVLGDVHPANIVYTECRAGGPECVCIDGFGEKAFIPVHRLSRWLNARKLDRIRGRVMECLARHTDA